MHKTEIFAQDHDAFMSPTSVLCFGPEVHHVKLQTVGLVDMTLGRAGVGVEVVDGVLMKRVVVGAGQDVW